MSANASRQTETHNGKEISVWVAIPGQMLSTAQRIENKTARKIARGEDLAGPFAASASGTLQLSRTKAEQDARIAALEKQVQDLLDAKNADDDDSKKKKA